MTGWLSGYIDGLGNFIDKTYVTGCKKFNAGTKISYLTFYITAYQKEFYILNVISEMLNIKIKNIKYSKDKDSLILSISSLKKLKLIVNYLKKYTLITNKSLVFTK